MIFFFAVLILVVFGGITGAVASSMGHKFWPFFFIGALISPLLGIILCFVIKPAARSRRVTRSRRRRPVNKGTRSVAKRGTTSFDKQNPYSPPRGNYR